MMTVFTITSHGYDIIWKKCIYSQKAYCERHGYTYHHIHLSSTLTPDTTAWMKLHFLRLFLIKARNFDTDTRWQDIKKPQRVMYIDADCEINDSCPDITSLEQSGKSLFVAPWFSGRINSGVLIARDDPKAIDLISLTIDNRKISLPDSDQVWRVYGGGENGHVIHYRKDHPIVQLIDQKWNNNHTVQLDDYIRHYSAGGPMRALYSMDSASKIAWYTMMIYTYWIKILRKIRLIQPYDKVQQPDGEEIVQARIQGIK